jgi:Lysylphosphatidylglycerol synthase TM region
MTRNFGYKSAAVWSLKLLLTVTAVILVIRAIPMQEVALSFRRVDALWAAAAVLALGLEYLVSSYKTGWMARAGSLGMHLKLNAMKTLVNQVFPGGVGGEAMRMLYLSRVIGSPGKAASLLVADRWAGFCTQLIWSGMCLIFVGWSQDVTLRLPWPLVPAGAFLVMAGALAWALGPTCLAWLATTFPAKLRFGPLKTLGSEAEHFSLGLRSWGRFDRRALGLFLICSCNQVAMLLLLLTASAALGYELNPWLASPIVLLGSLTAVVPSVLGSLGVQEGFFALGFHLSGGNASQGLSVSLFLRLVQLVPTAIGGYLFLHGFRPEGMLAADPEAAGVRPQDAQV